MRLRDLELKNFRNQGDRTIHFSDSISCIIGNNGARKTSIIEAIHTLSVTKSFKAKKEVEVIRHEAQFTRIQGIRDDDKTLSISYQKAQGNRVKKIYAFDDVSKRQSSFIGNLFSVLFTTDLINDFSDKSQTRRRFFNQFIAQLDKEYLQTMNAYERVIKNKTKVLKAIREGADSRQLLFWNQELVQLGTCVAKKRFEFIKRIALYLEEHHGKEGFAQKNISIAYLSEYVYEGNIAEKLQRDIIEYTPIEIDSGRCLVGPHRDDYDVFFDKKNIKSFASRGEQKFSIAFLLYAIARYIENTSATSPIILLDDISAEMDKQNLSVIMNLFIQTHYQIILTAIHDNHIIASHDSKIYLN